jgi:hypothetical protein
VLKQASPRLRSSKEAFNLSESEEKFIFNAKTGQGF